MHWRRQWQPTPVFLPGESQGRGSLVGCRLWGLTESDMTERRQQQQQQQLEWLDTSYFYIVLKVESIIQSCLTLCDPIDYTVLGILQARILEWVAFPFSMRSSKPRDQTQVYHIAGSFFTC